MCNNRKNKSQVKHGRNTNMSFMGEKIGSFSLSRTLKTRYIPYRHRFSLSLSLSFSLFLSLYDRSRRCRDDNDDSIVAEVIHYHNRYVDATAAIFSVDQFPLFAKLNEAVAI